LQLHQNAEEGVEALQMHPKIRKVTPQRKVQRFLHFTQGMNGHLVVLWGGRFGTP
jgi:hypothetical protein